MPGTGEARPRARSGSTLPLGEGPDSPTLPGPEMPRSSPRSLPGAYRLRAREGRRGAEQQAQRGGRWRHGKDEKEQQRRRQARPARARHSPAAATTSGLPGSDLSAGRGRPAPEEGLRGGAGRWVRPALRAARWGCGPGEGGAEGCSLRCGLRDGAAGIVCGVPSSSFRRTS